MLKKFLNNLKGFSIIYDAKPRWRNWKTQQTEALCHILWRAGSSPALGTAYNPPFGGYYAVGGCGENPL